MRTRRRRWRSCARAACGSSASPTGTTSSAAVLERVGLAAAASTASSPRPRRARASPTRRSSCAPSSSPAARPRRPSTSATATRTSTGARAAGIEVLRIDREGGARRHARSPRLPASWRRRADRGGQHRPRVELDPAAGVPPTAALDAAARARRRRRRAAADGPSPTAPPSGERARPLRRPARDRLEPAGSVARRRPDRGDRHARIGTIVVAALRSRARDDRGPRRRPARRRPRASAARRSASPCSTLGGRLERGDRPARPRRRIALAALGMAVLAWLAYVLDRAASSLPLLQPEQEDVTSELGDRQGLASVSVAVAGVPDRRRRAALGGAVLPRASCSPGCGARCRCWPAASISALVWGSLHLGGGNIGVAVQLSVFGVILAWLYERSGTPLGADHRPHDQQHDRLHPAGHRRGLTQPSKQAVSALDPPHEPRSRLPAASSSRSADPVPRRSARARRQTTAVPEAPRRHRAAAERRPSTSRARGPTAPAPTTPRPRRPPTRRRRRVRLKGVRGGKLTAGNKIERGGHAAAVRQGREGDGPAQPRQEDGQAQDRQRAAEGQGSSTRQVLTLASGWSSRAATASRRSTRRARPSAAPRTAAAPSGSATPTSTRATTATPSKTFNSLLAEPGYVNDEGAQVRLGHRPRRRSPSARSTAWPASENATASDFKKLAKGKGGYNLKHPGAGKHVEADLSRQVMVLAKGDEVDEIYHDLLGRAGDADDPRQVQLLPQGRGLQQPRDVLLGLLHPRLRDARLPLGARPTRRATAACATRSPTRSTSTTGSTSAIPSTSTASRWMERP